MPKKERAVAQKPPKTNIRPDREQPNAIVLKLREGSRMRLRDGKFHLEAAAARQDDRDLLRRASVTEADVEVAAMSINELLSQHPRWSATRMFKRREEVLEREKHDAEAQNDEEVGDPNLYYCLTSDERSVPEAEHLLDRLNLLAGVEIAYAQPISRPADPDIPPTTPDFSSLQYYLHPA